MEILLILFAGVCIGVAAMVPLNARSYERGWKHGHESERIHRRLLQERDHNT